uniref:peroxidase n=1 Tax=Medicago truncatula TaxID=3880 RepID=A2Q4B3_MEDTR|nr:Haem peroxidase, plant/fungal/bacterial [Medicago truncatula]
MIINTLKHLGLGQRYINSKNFDPPALDTKLVDKQLALDKSTSHFVSNFTSNGDKFVKCFATAMIKMWKIGVLGGNEGEIRKNCKVVNKLN